jgi:trimethylamine--corrinoid protein Co-methyltransferase
MDCQKSAAPQLRLFTEEQLRQVHLSTLKVLETVGVKVQHPEARQLMLKAGAEDAGGDNVRIPREVVEAAIEKAPSSIQIFDRDGEPRMALSGRNSYFGAGGPSPYIIDRKTGQRREFTIQDARELAVLVDSCDNIHFNMTMGHSSDVPVEVRDVHEISETLIASPKPLIIMANDEQNLSSLIEIFSIMAGDAQQLAKKPFVIFYTEPVTPLQHTFHSLGKLLAAVEAGLPILYTPAPMAGATGPVTLAGNLVVGNAELLSGLVLIQQKRPGTGVIYGGVFSTLDMAGMLMPYGSPELNLQTVAAAEMGKYYKLPTFGTAGCSDAHDYNGHSASEMGMSILVNALCGANLIHDVGWLEFANVTSLEAILACNETIGWAKRFLEGISIDLDAIGVDLICEMGIGGNFVDCDHTFNRYRSEQWFPGLFKRELYDNWVGQGAKTPDQKLKEATEKILAEHMSKPLDGKKIESIRQIIKKLENNYLKGNQNVR